jgi:hypothetical protein
MADKQKTSKRFTTIAIIAAVGVLITIAISAATEGRFGFNTEGSKQDTEAYSGDFIEFNEEESSEPEQPELVYMDSSELEAVNDYTGTATATREYNGTEFSHGLTAQTNPPAEGKFYEGWLTGGPDGFISTGKLELNDQDEWVLVFLSEMDMKDYDGIVVTEETEANGLDNIPEAHVFEGSF